MAHPHYDTAARLESLGVAAVVKKGAVRPRRGGDAVSDRIDAGAPDVQMDTVAPNLIRLGLITERSRGQWIDCGMPVGSQLEGKSVPRTRYPGSETAR
jgi:hypothetical protein